MAALTGNPADAYQHFYGLTGAEHTAAPAKGLHLNSVGQLQYQAAPPALALSLPATTASTNTTTTATATTPHTHIAPDLISEQHKQVCTVCSVCISTSPRRFGRVRDPMLTAVDDGAYVEELRQGGYP